MIIKFHTSLSELSQSKFFKEALGESIKLFPKGNSNMLSGTLKKIGHSGNPPYEFAIDDETPFLIKDIRNRRKQLMLYCCENCGFIKFYSK